jgi:hypothetical protein
MNARRNPTSFGLFCVARMLGLGAISTTRGHHWIIEDNTVHEICMRSMGFRFSLPIIFAMIQAPTKPDAANQAMTLWLGIQGQRPEHTMGNSGWINPGVAEFWRVR